ncbi:MAG TPA: YicC/YloC family endoribonuclease, partial [Rhizomicrobium sp.]|nr:YicC/YloC family endoribonuclease [Rhizomicrobium sp.]
RKETSAGELTISLRAVNHRGLDLHFFYSPELAPYENASRLLLKNGIVRGHVEIRTSLSRDTAESGNLINRAALARYVADFQAAASELKLSAHPDLHALLTLPGVIGRAAEQTELGPGFEAEISAALADCILELNDTREREGAALSAHITEEISAIEKYIEAIGSRRREITENLSKRLRSRLQELLAGSGVPESRLAEEAAILADRSDITEELTRLQVHIEELKRILANGGEVGKRLDFLLQELVREANTVLSKTANTGDLGLELTSAGLAIKAHLEKIREQALNLE